MKQVYLSIFFVFLASMSSVSQTIPEEYMHMAYRISFSNEKKGDIKLEIQAAENDSPYYEEGEWEKEKTQKAENVLFELHQGYPTSRGNTFAFSKKNQKMEIRTTTDLYNIPFLEGRYDVPREFAPLFQIQEGTAKIINQDISSFMVEEWEDKKAFVPLVASIPKNMTFSTQMDRIGQGKYFISGDDTSVFVYQAKMRKWNEFELPLRKEQHYIEHVSAGDRSILFATVYDREAKSRFTLYSKNGGDSWKRHKILSSLEVDWIKMYDKKIGYALGKFNDEYTAFYATENGGKTWQRVYEIKGDKYIILDTPSAQEIIIRNESNYGYPIYYKSDNGGKNWSISENHNDTDFFNLQIIFQNNLFSRKGRKKNAQLIFPKERRAYFNFVEKDKIYRAILANNYILYSKDAGKNWMFYPLDFEDKNHRSNNNRRYLKGQLSKLFFIDEKTLLYFNQGHLFQIKIP